MAIKREMKVKNFADALDVSTRTIKTWEKSGYLPEPKRNKWGHRVYSKSEIKKLVEFVKKKDYFRKKYLTKKK